MIFFFLNARDSLAHINISDYSCFLSEILVTTQSLVINNNNLMHNFIMRLLTDNKKLLIRILISIKKLIRLLMGQQTIFQFFQISNFKIKLVIVMREILALI